MKLYKFRSLANKTEFDEVKRIIKTGEFYFSDWDKMNDPMEGYFTAPSNEEGNSIAKQIVDEKNQYKICSFSNSWQNICMWSRYADNHKGICIEVEVSEDKVKEITYIEKITEIQELIEKGNENPDDLAKEILSRKFKQWKYESEWRMFGKPGLHEVGKITAVYFGTKCGKYKQDLIKVCKNKGCIDLADDFDEKNWGCSNNQS